MKILYSDDQIVIVNKPYGVSSQDGKGQSLTEMLREALGGEIYPVHRLDTQTTGLIVYARTKESAGFLSKEIQEKRVSKKYLCICHGEIEGEGTMVDYLFHDKLKNKSFVVDSKRRGSKEAVLDFRVLEKEKELSLLEIHLKTGRTHQIRVQLSSRKSPLYGDGKYGAKDNDKIHLHSYYLSLTHPKTGKKMELYSRPEDGAWESFDFVKKWDTCR
ncbi:MAG: RluA family pseudouridine synthase [Clostridia bacterium]|nr:RluA family pseudouridine synthase [Clostridia bacterium]